MGTCVGRGTSQAVWYNFLKNVYIVLVEINAKNLYNDMIVFYPMEKGFYEHTNRN